MAKLLWELHWFSNCNSFSSADKKWKSLIFGIRYTNIQLFPSRALLWVENHAEFFLRRKDQSRLHSSVTPLFAIVYENMKMRYNNIALVAALLGGFALSLMAAPLEVEDEVCLSKYFMWLLMRLYFVISQIFCARGGYY